VTWLRPDRRTRGGSEYLLKTMTAMIGNRVGKVSSVIETLVTHAASEGKRGPYGRICPIAPLVRILHKWSRSLSSKGDPSGREVSPSPRPNFPPDTCNSIVG
jgi:hypothetical protein